MKKIILTIFAAIVIGSFATNINAQMMRGFSNTQVDWDEVVEHTLREEQEGKELWNKLQAKEVACDNLSEEQFGVLGEYFMGQMAGDSHAAMNAMMIQMMGEEGEEQMHVAMGKRLSGCDTSAVFPSQGVGFMPMMQTMMGTYNSPMNFGSGTFGWLGWIFMILLWALIIVGIIAIIKWLINQSRRSRDHKKSPLQILKERYARGEIDKKEFEDKKKNLV